MISCSDILFMMFCTLTFLPRVLHSLFKNLIYLFLAVLCLRCCVVFSLVVVSRGYPSLQWGSFSLQWLLLQSTGSRSRGLVVVAPGLQSTGSVIVVHGLSCPPAHLPAPACGLFPSRDQTRVACTGRQALHLWATREVQFCISLHQPACLCHPHRMKDFEGSRYVSVLASSVSNTHRLYRFPLLRNKCHILRRSEQPLVLNSQFCRLGLT